MRPACSVPPCLGVPVGSLLEEDDEEEPQAAIKPPAPSARLPLAVFSSRVRRVIMLTKPPQRGTCNGRSVADA
jgi:hypothetical protein